MTMTKTFKSIEEKRKTRKKQTAEDFTPIPLINEILDKLSEYGPESWEEGKTFLDPACGNGNFLIEVYKRKLKQGHNPIDALKTIYGTDIMQDNINECRIRLLKIFIEHIKKYKLNKFKTKECQIEVIKTLWKNIKCTPLNKYPKGSLDYNFKFQDCLSLNQCKDKLKTIKEKNLIEKVTI